ncbi:MAG: hypothetical protein KGQ16_12970 [Cyanobacteria bacterium REEB444]|nr:hypothetical protein [Cyanobacteria bacterium REEB444]
MALSGLNLVVSAVGFAVLNEKLKRLEGKLNEIQQEVKAIRSLLEIEERAKLSAALRDLLSISEIKNSNHRHYDTVQRKKIYLAQLISNTKNFYWVLILSKQQWLTKSIFVLLLWHMLAA